MQVIENVRRCTMQVLNLSNLEKQLLKKKSKVEWLKLGDGNNAYFHASLKSKSRKTQILSLVTENGDTIFEQEKIEDEIVNFYRKLVGTRSSQLNSIDLVAMRQGKQLTSDQRASLTAPITEEEIVNSLKGISDISAPGIDGYNAKFFKATWNITKVDVISAVKEFFEECLIYKAVNCSLITLIPNRTMPIW